MAIELRGMTMPGLVAGADLSGSQYRHVKLSAAGTVVAAGAGELSIGILQNNPKQGQAAEVWCVGSISKCVAGAAVAANDLIKSDAQGRGVPATKAYVNTGDAGVAQDPLVGSYICGIAYSAAGAAGEIFSCFCVCMGAAPTTAV